MIVLFCYWLLEMCRCHCTYKLSLNNKLLNGASKNDPSVYEKLQHVPDECASM